MSANKPTVNKSFSVKTFAIGRENEQIIVIDDFMEDAEDLVRYATEHSDFYKENKAGNYYPGVRLPPPAGYFDAVYGALRPVLESVFNISTDMCLVKAESSLSLVTLRPDELNDLQCLPHFDTADPNQYALLHYLCRTPHQGTSFYRHNFTGYEIISDERFDSYTQAYMEDLELNGPPEKAYILNSNERYTKIGSVAAEFNRIVIYRSCLLHSADIASEVSINADPATGRLTANTFVGLC